MPSLKEVKSRIQSVVSTQQITKAMKMVAAAKLRKAQDRILQLRPYAQKLNGIMHNLSETNDSEEDLNIFNEQREVKRVLLVVITSDRGLCGAFNSNIFKQARQVIEENYAAVHAEGGLTIMPIGKRSYEYFSKRGYPVVTDYYGLFHNLTFDSARQAADFILEGFEVASFDKVEIIYNEFKNVATQIVRNYTLLPVQLETHENGTSQSTDYIFEPDRKFIFKEIVPKSLRIQFYKTILESNAAEHGARMTAMNQATDNATELLKELKLTYNRTRQAAITKEILEIVGGAEALSKGA